jgi:hypothetical protein
MRRNISLGFLTKDERSFLRNFYIQKPIGQWMDQWELSARDSLFDKGILIWFEKVEWGNRHNSYGPTLLGVEYLQEYYPKKVEDFKNYINEYLYEPNLRLLEESS